MKIPEFYEADLLAFFDGRPDGLALFEALYRRLDAAFPEASVKVQKSQISFYGAQLFAMASLPRRKRDGGIVVSFGLDRRLNSPRVAIATEPYPGRWTHHVPVTEPEEIEGELLGWLAWAWDFARTK